jgi:two-component system, OmpR family, phosphate regulon sensor histidine kinase PhoR
MNASVLQNVNTLDDVADVWQQLAEATTDILYVISPQGDYRDVNPRLCKVLQQPREKLMGSRVTALLSHDEAALTERALQDIVAQRSALRFTRTYLLPGGETRVFEVCECPLMKDGQVAAVAGIGREITQEVTLEHKLWDAAESRRAGVDFALRTSLGLVKGYVCTLRQTTVMDETRRERYVRILEEEIDHLAKMIEDMLDVQRLENGEWEPQCEVMDLVECLRLAHAQCEDEAARRNIELRLETPAVLDPLYAPQEAVARILLNLLQNAVQYTMDGGRVVVAVQDHDAYVDVIFKDSGIGIPESELPYIFDKFYRGRSSAAAPGQGTGMGLAISRMLIEALGGRITVTSRVGKGSEFRAVFPRRPLDQTAVGRTNSWASFPVMGDVVTRP